MKSLPEKTFYRYLAEKKLIEMPRGFNLMDVKLSYALEPVGKDLERL